jgi:hypothetical protein
MYRSLIFTAFSLLEIFLMYSLLKSVQDKLFEILNYVLVYKNKEEDYRLRYSAV